MNKVYKIMLLAISPIFICEFCFSQSCDPQAVRYRSRDFFSSNQVIKDVRYWFKRGGFFSPSRSQNMDIYLPPASDSENQRPVVVWMHGGGFVAGNKTIGNAALFCSTLAKMGYVAVSIDYRKDIIQETLRIPSASERAVYKGIQDGRSAIRFLKANASTLGIDVDNIFMAGSSAGAFIALHNAYLSEAERPSNTFGGFLRSDLGCLDCGEGNNDPGNGETDAILALWGALGTSDYIEPGETVPALLIHGTADRTVSAFNAKPFSNVLPAFLSPLPRTDGSAILNDKLVSLGTSAPDFETYLFPSERHSFWDGPDATFDFIMTKTIDFFFQRLGNLQTISAVSGATASAAGASQTYSIPATPGASYCWEVVRGDIISSNQNTISVRWNSPNRAGTVTVVETLDGIVSKSSSLIVDVGSGNVNRTQPFKLEGEQIGEAISLVWEVAPDSDYDYFIMEKTSGDGWFEDIGEVAIASNVKGAHAFSFQDVLPVLGENVYRLKRVDKQGNISYSSTLNVQYQASGQLGVVRTWPNPMTDKLFIDFTASEKTMTQLIIIDVNGKQVLEQAIATKPGMNHLEVSAIGLDPGFYVLSIGTGKEASRIKLIK